MFGRKRRSDKAFMLNHRKEALERKREIEDCKKKYKIGTTFTFLSLNFMVTEVDYNYGCKSMLIEAMYVSMNREICVKYFKEELLKTIIQGEETWKKQKRVKLKSRKHMSMSR